MQQARLHLPYTFATILTRALTLAAVFAFCPSAFAAWGGTAAGLVTTTTVDTFRNTAVDQQYTLFTDGQVTPQINYLLTGRYRHLQIIQSHAPRTWLTELQPNGSIRWTNNLFAVRGEHAQRFNHDRLGANNLTGRSTTAFIQTNWHDLPRLYANADWTRNLNDLELIGFDTRSRTLGAGLSYSVRQVSLLYEFSDQITKNARTNIDRLSRAHLGRIDNSLHAWKQLVTLETSYQIVNRDERDRDRNSGESLIPLSVVSGLYAADPSPDFDALNSAPGLVDGTYNVPASPDYDLSANVFHNFGLDFGAPVQFDHLYLYTDTLANPGLRWSIWTSADNQTWTRIREPESAPFTPVFNRYEFAFPIVETRYIKLTVEPELAVLPVRVTELRGFIARGSQTVPETATDQRGSAQLRLQPAQWLSVSFGGRLARRSASQTAIGSEDDGLQGGLRFAPGARWEFGANYERSRSRYPESTRETATTEDQNLQLRWTQSAALAAMATANRRSEFQDRNRIRRSDGARLEVRTVILPALRGTTMASYNEDHRYDNRDIFYTRTYGQLIEGEPTPAATLSADAHYIVTSARLHSTPGHRLTFTGRASYRLTDALTAAGQADYFREPGLHTRTLNGSVAWMTTPKLTLTLAADQLTGTGTPRSTQYSAQTYFRWTARTDLTAAYSLTRQERSVDSANARFGLNTRF
jgi:hypothetical protein